MKSVARTSFGEPDSQTEISSNPAAGFFLTQEHTSPRLNALPFSEFRNAERELLYVSSCPMDETKNPEERRRGLVFFDRLCRSSYRKIPVYLLSSLDYKSYEV